LGSNQNLNQLNKYFLIKNILFKVFKVLRWGKTCKPKQPVKSVSLQSSPDQARSSGLGVEEEDSQDQTKRY
jgi:hypothetical protein